MVYKGRDREHRGRLNCFTDLPEISQEIFKQIKIEVRNELNNIDAYVFGSFLHGYWDMESDYDILIMADIDTRELNEKISKKIGVKVEVFCSNNTNNMILIP